MSCCFENTLHYSSPGHGDWGVVRIGMLAPESVQLFVCPSACGRHGAIGAMKQGLKDRLFYLYVSQSDIVDGYDPLIPEAVKNVLEALKKQPKVFFIFVSCLDDLIGTDHEALLEELGNSYPGIQFRVCHMNPIPLGSKTPPPVSIQNNLYSLLEPAQDRDSGVNAVGNLEPVALSSELYPFLNTYGAGELRHISRYTVYEQYQEMSRSRANLVIGPPGRQAAGQMEERLGIPWVFIPVSYDMEEIEGGYARLKQLLAPDAEDCFDFAPARERALKAVERARRRVGDIPVIIDASATVQPFGMAKALLTYGFQVTRVEAQDCMPFDREHMEWLVRNHPKVEICQPEHHRAVLFSRRLEYSLGIGVEGAYLAGSRHVADLFNDAGMFGYDGIVRLMGLMEGAMEAEVDLEQMINGYGLVV